MRLTSLTLQGFKSFANKTTLEFTPGITAIVGPNGSGKSNVIDALRWASGGGRASEFRAEGKTDLIFHGAAGGRSLGYAEVAVEVERGGKSVHVSRSLFRDGQTKLKLGGKNARFLDVDEALSGSGLARGGLSIIGQGEVSQVLMADPPTLLSYVEEAAGVAKLSSRREQTLSRLAAAREHLERLEDVMRELRRQLETLEKEAGEAQRSASLSREQLALRYTLALRRAESLQRDLTELEARRQNVVAGLEHGKAQLGAAREAWSRSRAVLAQTEEVYRRAVQDAEARRGDLRVAQERLAAARSKREGLAREARGVAEELAALVGAEAPTPPEGDVETLRRTLSVQDADLEMQREQVAGLETHLGDLNKRLETARHAAFAEAQKAERFEAQKESLEAQLRNVIARLEGLETDIDVAGLEAEVARAQAADDARASRLGALQERLATLQNAHASAHAEAQARQRAFERVRAAFDARRGYAQGPKNALTSGIPGVVGSVADLLRVPGEYQTALGSALGRRAEHVVVESAEVAKEVLAHVRRAGGWVTLLPLELVRGKPGTLAAELRNEPSVVGLCAELVEVDPKYMGIVNQLLGTTALVTSLDDAVTLARRYARRPRFVTLRGDVMEAYGAMTGGRPQGSGAVLGLGADLEEAGAAALAASREAAAQGEALRRLQADVREVLAQRRAQSAALDRATEALRRAREQAAAQGSLRSELARQRLELEARLAALTPPEPSGDAAQVATLETQVSNEQTHLTALRQEVRAAEGARNETAQALALLGERQKDFAQALARFQAGQARLGQVEARAKTLQRELAAAQSAEQVAESGTREAEARVPQSLEPQENALSDARRSAQRAEDALGELTQRQAERGASLEEVKLTLARRETAAETAQEEYAGFPEGVEVLEGGLKGLRDRLSAVTQALENLGPVNHRAAHEAQVQRERWENLVAQSNEANLAAAELTSVLTDIESTVQTRLSAATAQLRANFAEHIVQLFGAGAEASIDTVTEEGRPTGLKISLQPPGKQTRSLNLLSVGERTMGAMAFLFALMSGEGETGLPIAILDEVDAPLDEANIRRFCAFLEQLASSGTQFVLITHQKATMETARTLWGVTTERGVSRVFSISRAEAEAAVK